LTRCMLCAARHVVGCAPDGTLSVVCHAGFRASSLDPLAAVTAATMVR
jgi:hypothetical protein